METGSFSSDTKVRRNELPVETELVSSRAEVRTRDPDFPISSRSDPASPSGEVKTATLQALRGTFQSSAAAPPKGVARLGSGALPPEPKGQPVLCYSLPVCPLISRPFNFLI